MFNMVIFYTPSKIGSVDPIGRTWTIWNMNSITPTCLSSTPLVLTTNGCHDKSKTLDHDDDLYEWLPSSKPWIAMMISYEWLPSSKLRIATMILYEWLPNSKLWIATMILMNGCGVQNFGSWQWFCRNGCMELGHNGPPSWGNMYVIIHSTPTCLQERLFVYMIHLGRVDRMKTK